MAPKNKSKAQSKRDKAMAKNSQKNRRQAAAERFVARQNNEDVRAGLTRNQDKRNIEQQTARIVKFDLSPYLSPYELRDVIINGSNCLQTLKNLVERQYSRGKNVTQAQKGALCAQFKSASSGVGEESKLKSQNTNVADPPSEMQRLMGLTLVEDMNIRNRPGALAYLELLDKELNEKEFCCVGNTIMMMPLNAGSCNIAHCLQTLRIIKDKKWYEQFPAQWDRLKSKCLDCIRMSAEISIQSKHTPEQVYAEHKDVLNLIGSTACLEKVLKLPQDKLDQYHDEIAEACQSHVLGLVFWSKEMSKAQLKKWDIQLAQKYKDLANGAGQFEEKLRKMKVELKVLAESYQGWLPNDGLLNENLTVALCEIALTCKPKDVLHHVGYQIYCYTLQQDLWYTTGGCGRLWIEKDMKSLDKDGACPVDASRFQQINAGRAEINFLVAKSKKEEMWDVLTYLEMKAQTIFQKDKDVKIQLLWIEYIGTTLGIVDLKWQLKAMMPTGVQVGTGEKKLKEVASQAEKLQATALYKFIGVDHKTELDSGISILKSLLVGELERSRKNACTGFEKEIADLCVWFASFEFTREEQKVTLKGQDCIEEGFKVIDSTQEGAKCDPILLNLILQFRCFLSDVQETRIRVVGQGNIMKVPKRKSAGGSRAPKKGKVAQCGGGVSSSANPIEAEARKFALADEIGASMF